MTSPVYVRQLAYFDDGLGYGRWHEACCAAMEQPAPADETAFAVNGIEKLKLLGEAQVQKVLDHVRSAEASGRNVYKYDPYISLILLSKNDYARFVLTSLLNGDVDKRLVAYFGSEYLIRCFWVCRTSPHPVSESSFLWHRDGGPTAQVKLILYVNGTEEHGARTDFVDEPASEKIMGAGYAFPAIKDREPDLSVYAAKAGVPWPPPETPMKAGEAVLFRPSLVLHRGILPTSHSRYTITLCLLPSVVPWRVHFDRHPVVKFQDPASDCWEAGFPEELAQRNRHLLQAVSPAMS